MSLHGENEEAENQADWKKDEEAFEAHFDISYDDFAHLILSLPPALAEKYERTRKTNEEAAILWAIHEGRNHGLIEEQE